MFTIKKLIPTLITLSLAIVLNSNLDAMNKRDRDGDNDNQTSGTTAATVAKTTRDHRIDPALRGLSREEIIALQYSRSHVQTHRHAISAEMINRASQATHLPSNVLGLVFDFLPNADKNKATTKDPDFEHIARMHCTHLDLSFQSDTAIKKALFYDNDEPRFESLLHLNLYYSKITDATISKICSVYNILKTLNLYWSNNLTDKAVQAIAANCHQLQDLDLSYCNNLTNPIITSDSITRLTFSFCKKLTGAAVQAIAANCHQLKDLDLSSCNNLTDAAVQAVATNYPQLQYLNLSYCKNLTDFAVQDIANNCHQLKELDLSYCNNLTDAAVQAIANNCPQLQKIYLHWCDNLTNPVITSNSITTLDLCLCDNLTDTAVQAIANNCPQLQKIYLSGCPLVLQATKDTLRARGIKVI